MKTFATTDQEVTAYAADVFDDLTVQDALTILALFTLRLGPVEYRKDLRRVETILQRQPSFEEPHEQTRVRLQKFENAFQSVDPQEAVKHAKKVLAIAGAEKKAQDVAAEVAASAASTAEEKKAVMKKVSSVLVSPK